MKNVKFGWLLVLLAAVSLNFVSCVQSPNQALNKALNKEYRTKMKQLEKGHWELTASSRTLEVALLTHYQKLADANNRELVGTSQNCSSPNVCRQAALNNACSYYASLAGSHLKGRVVSDMAANMTDSKDKSEFDKFYAAYERLVDKEIKGEIQESFTIVRKVKNDKKEMQTFFVVNEDAASQARIRAWENAKNESEAAQKYGNLISDFVKEGFEVPQE